MKPKFNTGDRVRVAAWSGLCAYRGRFGTIYRVSFISDQAWRVKMDVHQWPDSVPDSVIFDERDLELINGLDVMLELL